VTVHQTEFEQGSLVKHRLFVALRPPPGVIPALARLRAQATPRTIVADDRLHLTLFVTEDFESEPAALAATMTHALATVRAEAFPVTLDRYGRYGDSLQPARATKLRAFQKAVAHALADAGVAPRASWTFSPHMTLGYGASEAMAGAAIKPVAWTANEVVLIHSLLRLTIHRTLGRWPLIEQPRLL